MKVDGKNGCIVIIGASFAAGWVSKEIVGFPLINKGVGGETSSKMHSRFEKDVIHFNPSAVIIWGFINDILNSKSESIQTTMTEVRNNIKEMVELAQATEIIPILVAEPTIRGPGSWLEALASRAGKVLGKASYQDYINKHVLVMNQWLREYAKAKNLRLIDLQFLFSDEKGVRKKEYTAFDGIHISLKGYEKMSFYAEEILRDFRTNH